MQKILVVDDAVVNRELLREMLEDNYVIEMAENGQQALRKLLEFKEELAAVLLDLQMPKADGDEGERVAGTDPGACYQY